MSTLAETLDSVLPSPEQRETWSIQDDSAAEWALRKLAHLTEEMESARQLANAEIQRYVDWLREKQEAFEKEAGFFESKLKAYHMRRFTADPKLKTIKLPHGVLKCRIQQPEYTRDDTALIAWAETNRPDVIERKPSLMWAALKKTLVPTEPQGAIAKVVDMTTGEVVEGVTALIRPEKYDVELVGVKTDGVSQS